MLDVYTLEQSEQWDAIVRSFKDYDVYWLSGYVKAFHLHGDGQPLLFFYEQNGTRGIHVVMRRDVADDNRFSGKIPAGRFFDLASPYGYGGWLIEGTDAAGLFATYQKRLQCEGIISEFVRFHPMIGNHEICRSFYEIVQLGEVVHMDLTSPEVIWNNVTSKNRNMIRKAIKNCVRIYNGRLPDLYETFQKIYDATMDKDGADRYYYFDKAFYRSLLEDLPHHAQVFCAEKDGVVIAAAIMLSANGFMNYHLSGSLPAYGSLAPTNLLLYEAALWGCANGCRTLYLGGGVGSGEDSLFCFKRAFYRGELHRFHIGKKIYDQASYDHLTALRDHIARDTFFPLYRG